MARLLCAAGRAVGAEEVWLLSPQEDSGADSGDPDPESEWQSESKFVDASTASASLALQRTGWLAGQGQGQGHGNGTGSGSGPGPSASGSRSGPGSASAGFGRAYSGDGGSSLASDFAVVSAVRRSSGMSSSSSSGKSHRGNKSDEMEVGWKRAHIRGAGADSGAGVGSGSGRLPLAREALRPHVLVVLEQATRMRRVVSVAPLEDASHGGARRF